MSMGMEEGATTMIVSHAFWKIGVFVSSFLHEGELGVGVSYYYSWCQIDFLLVSHHFLLKIFDLHVSIIVVFSIPSLLPTIQDRLLDSILLVLAKSPIPIRVEI